MYDRINVCICNHVLIAIYSENVIKPTYIILYIYPLIFDGLSCEPKLKLKLLLLTLSSDDGLHIYSIYGAFNLIFIILYCSGKMGYWNFVPFSVTHLTQNHEKIDKFHRIFSPLCLQYMDILYHQPQRKKILSYNSI